METSSIGTDIDDAVLLNDDDLSDKQSHRFEQEQWIA